VSESKIQNEIRLAVGRDPDLVLWRNQVGVATYISGETRRHGLCPGSCDLIGILAPHGRFIALEIKTATGKISPEQERFINLVNRKGGYAKVVRSVDEALTAIQEAKLNVQP
jgi:hypothetical protein